MASDDAPPAHVPAWLVPVTSILLQIGGLLWTLAYILYTRESFRSKSYGMPLFALALNFAWEFVYAFFFTEQILEKTVFMIWLLLDCGMIYGVIKYAKHEWRHAPIVAQNIFGIFLVLAGIGIAGHYTFAKWWVDNEIGRKEGKFYKPGQLGPDMTELGFWSALVCQAYLSAASLAQVCIRQHTGGVSWSIWVVRFSGSIIGFYALYALEWYYWREAHEYVMNPFAIFLWTTCIVSDAMYPLAHKHAESTERILSDGRKVAGFSIESSEEKDR